MQPGGSAAVLSAVSSAPNFITLANQQVLYEIIGKPSETMPLHPPYLIPLILIKSAALNTLFRFL